MKKSIRYLPFIIMLFISIFTFFTQNKNVGFGIDNHGWVSSHVLAIINRANYENNFVGFTQQRKNKNNQVKYEYFDRYPIFFSAISNLILSKWNDNIAAKVYHARQMMNIYFILTLVLSYLLLAKITGNKLISLSASLLTFSNYHLLYYKDMIHFDQPALLGSMLLIYCIARYKINNSKSLLYIGSIASVSLGRGYANYSVLVLWFFIETLLIIRDNSKINKVTITHIINHTSLKTLFLGIVIGSASLFYNIYIESNKTNTSILNVGIVSSALGRLPIGNNIHFKKTYVEKHKEELTLFNFTEQQVGRIADLIIPSKSASIEMFKFIILISILIFIAFYFIKQERNIKILLALLTISGFFWLFPLRNLAAFHNYTSMYYIGIPLVFYLSVLSLFNKYNKLIYLFLAICIVTFCIMNIKVNNYRNHLSKVPNEQTADFSNISKIISPKKNVYIHKGYRKLIKHSPYAVYFYLPNQYITKEKGSADYFISKKKNYRKNNLTPDNNYFYLFKK